MFTVIAFLTFHLIRIFRMSSFLNTEACNYQNRHDKGNGFGEMAKKILPALAPNFYKIKK